MAVDAIELIERHNALIAKAKRFKILTIASAIIAFALAMFLLFFAGFRYAILAIVIFIPVYAIAYKSAKNEIIAQINAIESTEGMNEKDKKIIETLKNVKILAKS